ncbi:hypothetical protein D3C87_902280 [compost metagenome]
MLKGMRYLSDQHVGGYGVTGEMLKQVQHDGWRIRGMAVLGDNELISSPFEGGRGMILTISKFHCPVQFAYLLFHALICLVWLFCRLPGGFFEIVLSNKKTQKHENNENFMVG